MKNVKTKIAAVMSAVMMSMSITVPTLADETSLGLINNATSDTIATALSTYLTEVSKNTLYDVLPQCDKTAINERLLKGKPYVDEDALAAAYQTALEYATQADWSVYGKTFVEDFSTGLETNGWTSENLRNGAVGSANVPGIENKGRATLNISGTETASAILCGGSLNTATTKSVITKPITNPKSIITFYMKELNSGTTIGVQFNDTQAFSTSGGDTFRPLNSVETISWGEATSGSVKDADGNYKWTKVTIDGATEKGKVKAYVDGVLCHTFTGEINQVTIGQVFTGTGFSVTSVDNISVAEITQEYINNKFAEFNSASSTAQALDAFLPYTSKSADVYSALPECDRNNIALEVQKGKPYETIEKFEEKYQKALEYTTQADYDKYEKVFVEDFSTGLETNGWTSKDLRAGAVGTGNLLKTRETLNISGTENASAIILGGQFNNTKKGDTSYISKAITNPKSIITFYMKELNTQTTIGVKFNDTQGFSTRGDKAFVPITSYNPITWGDTAYGNIKDADGNYKWTKVRIDGASSKGKVNVYVDDVLCYVFTGEINQLTIGQTYESETWSVTTVDNISVVTPYAEKAVLKYNGIDVENIIPANAENVTFEVSNLHYETDYIIAGYDTDGELNLVDIITKEDLETATSKEINVTNLSRLEVFSWDDIETMAPQADVMVFTK